MKDLKISSKYDNHMCTLENGEKLFSAEVTLYSSDRELQLFSSKEWRKQMKRGFKNKAKMILRTLACIERLEYYLELAKGTPYGDANFIKEDIAIYKKYLNPKRKTNTYKTRDLIFINRLVNELRIHIKKYLHDRHGLKKEDK